ncbi:MAG: S8 family serine peptidase [Hyphomicrobiales bacterium]|nr:S8 family serine peptidase [Hyphomicrobiales bacterium]MBV8823611.1 S8 family serine peptidase [Hyphomicrobiales bacterium]MBV9429769.1 S8 family serine peptidase [Bradyrhizobiaceae bacterium]
MKRGTLTRVFLSAALAVAASDAAPAQIPPPNNPPIIVPPPIVIPPPVVAPPPTFGPGSSTPGRSGPSHNDGVLYIVSGIVFAIVGWAIGTKLFGDGPPPPASPVFGPSSGGGTLPPPRVTQVQGTGGGGGGAGSGGAGGEGNGGSNFGPAHTSVNLPPRGETRFVIDEVLADTSLEMEVIAQRHQMTCPETVQVHLTGHTLHRCVRLAGQSVTDMINALARERIGSQPNYLYRGMEDPPGGGNAEQYAPEKLDVIEAHRLATGKGVAVAVIDSGVDPNHPDLAGAITGSYDAANSERPHPHGTGMAGAIASRGTVLGIAPGAELLTVRAFSANSGSAEGTTLNIIKGLDWAFEKGARVVNMSFAGPADPRLRDALTKANGKGMVLIAAAGNAGPTSPPLFPAADPVVIAVTAVDASDALFSGANRGKYIAVAAPGVDVLVPAPDASYQLTTGTSVAAAEVSGVVALLLERNPRLTPKDVRRILMRTAKHLGPRGSERDYGAGLVDALQAVTAARAAGM